MTQAFATMLLPVHADVLAPDGSQVRILPRLAGGSMAHFTLAPGHASKAIMHRTIEEIWYVLAGNGEMWRSAAGQVETVPLVAGTALTIPCGVHFQFRSLGPEPLEAVAITMPPWPGDDEAVFVTGPWLAP